MYTITRHTAEIPVEEYLEKYVDISTFLEACKACPNYGHVWSCPPYDFDVTAYWRKYSLLKLTGSKIAFDEDALSKTYTKEELDQILKDVLFPEKEKLSVELMEQEKQFPGSISLSAGRCQSCVACTRADGKPCRHPEGLRYSIESLGGNVGLTAEKLLGLHLEWMETDRLPRHFVLVCGLLVP